MHCCGFPDGLDGKKSAYSAQNPGLISVQGRSSGEGNDNPHQLEGMMLKLKLQYFGHLIRRVDSLEKTDAGRDWGQEDKGTTEDEMAGWHHRLDGCEFE